MNEKVAKEYNTWIEKNLGVASGRGYVFMEAFEGTHVGYVGEKTPLFS
jgi:hypothetical protein